MTNINGKAYAMNAITPMKPWKTPILKLIFFILGAWKAKQKDLKNLSFIHFARWVCIRRTEFPRLSDQQPAEDLRYDYLLFSAISTAPGTNTSTPFRRCSIRGWI